MDVTYIPIDFETIDEAPDKFSITLGDVDFVFVITWNATSLFYSCDIYDENESPVLLGRKLVYGEDLLEGLVDSRIPSTYHIIPCDKTGDGELKNRIDLFDLGNSLNLYFWED